MLRVQMSAAGNGTVIGTANGPSHGATKVRQADDQQLDTQSPSSRDVPPLLPRALESTAYEADKQQVLHRQPQRPAAVDRESDRHYVVDANSQALEKKLRGLMDIFQCSANEALEKYGMVRRMLPAPNADTVSRGPAATADVSAATRSAGLVLLPRAVPRLASHAADTPAASGPVAHFSVVGPVPAPGTDIWHLVDDAWRGPATTADVIKPMEGLLFVQVDFAHANDVWAEMGKIDSPPGAIFQQMDGKYTIVVSVPSADSGFRICDGPADCGDGLLPYKPDG